MKKLIGFITLAAVLSLGFAQQQTGGGGQAGGGQTQATDFIGQSIADVLRTEEDFETIRIAVQGSQINQQISGDGTFTLFAPNNDAFSQVSQQQLDQLSSGLQNYLVQGTLTTQVLEGMLQARGGQMSLPTVGGSELSFTLDENNQVVVGGVAQLGREFIVANGVVLAINNVISTQGGGQ